MLESAFGKLKAKAGESAQGELTGMAMSRGAILGKHDAEEVREALDAVPQKKAEGMISRLLGRSFGSQAAGCRFVERILTVVQTRRLQGKSVLEYLHDALVAK